LTGPGIVNWHGDILPIWSCSRSRNRRYSSAVQSPNMTAIVSSYSPEGFAVGADGLRRDRNTGVEVTDKARKIFAIGHDEFIGVHAWSGSISLFYGDGRQPFNFLDHAQAIAQDMSSIAVNSASDYALKFSQDLYNRLAAYDSGASSKADAFHTKEVVRALFVGYAKGVPSTVTVSLRHENGAFLEPVLIQVCEEPYDLSLFSGSVKVWEELPPTIEIPKDIKEATNKVRNYIQACIDKRNHYPDCADIGGHIHIASVTPYKFEWVDPPQS
jgi:hypothetical protein